MQDRRGCRRHRSTLQRCEQADCSTEVLLHRFHEYHYLQGDLQRRAVIRQNCCTVCTAHAGGALEVPLIYSETDGKVDGRSMAWDPWHWSPWGWCTHRAWGRPQRSCSAPLSKTLQDTAPVSGGCTHTWGQRCDAIPPHTAGSHATGSDELRASTVSLGLNVRTQGEKSGVRSTRSAAASAARDADT